MNKLGENPDPKADAYAYHITRTVDDIVDALAYVDRLKKKKLLPPDCDAEAIATAAVIAQAISAS